MRKQIFRHFIYHQFLVLRPSCVPKKVGVNKKGVNRKLLSHKERQISGNKPTKEVLNHK